MRWWPIGVALAGLLGSGAARARCTLAKIADLPVTMAGLRPLVDARLNDRPVRLIADSGAFYSLLSPSIAAELKLPLTPAPMGFHLRGVGGEARASTTSVKSFTVAGVTIPNVQFLVGGSDIGSGAGLLGQNVLGVRDTEYDLGGGMIRLFNPQGCAVDDLPYWAPAGTPVAVVPLEPRDMRNPHVIGTVFVNGTRLRALFDTGAPLSSLTQAAAARLGVHPNDPGVTPAGMARGLGSRVLPSWTAPFASLALGEEQIRNIRLRFTANPDAEYDMLIGADFFLSHHVYVANGLHRMVLTYRGGPVFDLSRQAGGGTPPPSPAVGAAGAGDAGALGLEAAALAARRDYAGALAAYDKAVAAAPTDAALLAARAQVRLALRQPLLAAQDLDAALALDPDAAETRLVRAALRAGARDPAGARADVDAVAAKAAAPANIHLALAGFYQRLDVLDQAVAQYDLWLASHPEDSHRPEALNGRCWARALQGTALPAALKDCDAAVRARPGWSAPLDSRALVRLRMGDPAKAAADYDAALKLAPANGWSLYGRSLARRATGDTAGADADRAAAVAIAPNLPAFAHAHGIGPGG